MARRTAKRIRVMGQLLAVAPVHVGGAGGANELSDMPQAIDGQGRPYLPGTSLTGALRALAGRLFAADLVARLLGDDPRQDSAAASLLSVADAPVVSGPAAEIRDGVGIDRITGAAAEGIKYDRELLPAGTRFNLVLSLEVPIEGGADVEAALGHLLDHLTSDRGLRLGAGGTRGLGRVRLAEGYRLECLELRSKAALLGYLRTGQRAKLDLAALRDAASLTVAPVDEWRVCIDWRPRGPLMVNSGRDGAGVDMLPLLTAQGEVLVPVLPGSSIKGALRSHAERILRTVLGHAANAAVRGRERFMAHLEDERLDLVHWLFGAPGQRGGQRPAQPAEPAALVVGRGALSAEDCLAQAKIAPERWADLANAVNEAEVAAGLEAAGLSKWQQAMHVAVDRWTGGAAEHMLYSTVEPFDLAWSPIELTVDLARLPDDQRDAALALLLLVLRDLAADRIPLGFAVNRGMGSVAVRQMTVTATGQAEERCSLPTELLDEQGRWAVTADQVADLTAAWRRAIGQEAA